MKKILSVILALAMLLCLSTAAFAAENTSLTIEDSDGRTYAGYQLLKLTTSLKGDAHHTAHEGEHTSDCYNYAYTVNEKYEAIFQVEVFNNGGNYLWEGGTKPATASEITDAQILKYLSNQTGDNGDVFHTMRQVADRLYRAILGANLAPDVENLTGTDTIEQGYWAFVDVTELDGNEANSLVMVDTKGQDALTVTPKTALPTVEKKVKDIEDSEDSNITDNAWHDSADHDFNDVIPFKLTGTLPSNAAYYESFTMVFHDTMAEGLTFNPGSVKVYMYETKHKADVDTDLNDYAQDVTDKFVLTTENLEDGCTFEIGCDNVFTITGVTKDTAFVVFYDATLNEGAAIGAAGNPNTVTLEFSNNPYGDGTGMTEEDKVTVFTYQLIINKTDSHGHELEGAGFTLYKKILGSDQPDAFEQVGEVLGGEGSTMTTFTWEGLDDGDYKLVESTVPAGYNQMAEIVFSVAAAHSETDGEPVLISLDGGQMGTGVIETGTITKDIVNNTGTILPETGAQGTMLLIGGGTMLAILAAVFMVTRKKMSIFED